MADTSFEVELPDGRVVAVNAANPAAAAQSANRFRISELEQALIKADAAGDSDGARTIAGEIKRVRASDLSNWSDADLMKAYGKAPPDQYQQAALDERQAGGGDTNVNAVGRFLRNAVVPAPLRMAAGAVDDLSGGYLGALAQRGQQGATFGARDEILAGLETPSEMYRRGTIDPREGYNFAKAREDLSLSDAKAKTGIAGDVAEIGGGIATGMALAPIGAARFLAPNAGLMSRMFASAADAAGVGAFAGAAEGQGLAERGEKALTGGLLGGALGGIAPAAVALGGAAISPIVSNLKARINPTRFGQSQVARGISESGMTPAQITQQVAQAGNEGQGMFTVADAMGNSGQRLLSSTARAPGQARTDVVNFLDNRQAGQGRRISNALAEGFDSPQTAAQTRTRLETARDTDANASYRAVRQGAGRTDVTGAIRNIDETLGPGTNQMLANPGSAAANDSVEAALLGFRNRLARTNPDDFASIQRIRGDMSDAAQSSVQQGYGNRARLIRDAMRELDGAMENASAGYRQANRNFAQASRDIEAVNTGRQSAMRGRPEDTIPAFQGLGQNGQQAFRAGYSDPLIEAAQSAPFGANKARPLINDAFADEAAAMAPGNPLMQRRIGREDTMFQTRNAAMGNSKTVENLADDAALGLDPTIVGSLVTQIGSGNIGGALRTMLGAGQNAWTGNTPAVRQAVADILLTRGGNVNAAQFQRMLDQTVQRIQQVQQLARAMGRGAVGGLAVAGGNR